MILWSFCPSFFEPCGDSLQGGGVLLLALSCSQSTEANSATAKSSQRQRNQANSQRETAQFFGVPSVSSVGPCALEYTKMKTADHFWTDPSADELVQRHRIHGGHCRQDSPTKRPALCVSTNKRQNGRLLRLMFSGRAVIGTRCSAALGLSGSTTLITLLARSRDAKNVIYYYNITIISEQKSEFHFQTHSTEMCVLSCVVKSSVFAFCRIFFPNIFLNVAAHCTLMHKHLIHSHVI